MTRLTPIALGSKSTILATQAEKNVWPFAFNSLALVPRNKPRAASPSPMPHETAVIKVPLQSQSSELMPSPLSPAADMLQHRLLAAMCQEATYAPQQNWSLFDHLVGNQQRRRHGKTERFGRHEIA
jgi:hypothetical protein